MLMLSAEAPRYFVSAHYSKKSNKMMPSPTRVPATRPLLHRFVQTVFVRPLAAQWPAQPVPSGPLPVSNGNAARCSRRGKQIGSPVPQKMFAEEDTCKELYSNVKISCTKGK